MSEGGPRKLSLFDATMLVMGSILGVGIFFNPSQVAGLVPSTPLYMGAWALGCLVALCGAFTFAEFAASYPKAGGWFVYLREIYGRPVAFLLAWVVLLVISTGAQAVMCGFGASMIAEVLANAEGASPIGEPRSTSHTLMAGAIIVGLTLVALGGVKTGATIQNACMLIKLGLVLALIFAGLLFFAPSAPVPEVAPVVTERPLWQGFTLAMLPVFFSCGGWPLVAYVASEVKDPQRNVPRALLYGVGGVMLLYLLLNAAYLNVVGMDYLAQNPLFVGEVVQRSFGGVGSKFVSAGMAVSALGVCTVTVVTTPWLYVAMAREGLFFEGFARLHGRTGAPSLGLALQCALALGYLLFTNTEFLVDAAVFVEWIFHVLLAFGLLWIRHKRPELPRPFRSFAYPLLPTIYALFALFLVAGVLWQAEAAKTKTGLGVILAGMVVYPFWRRFVARAG